MQMNIVNPLDLERSEISIEHFGAFSLWQEAKTKENREHMLRAHALRAEDRQPLIVVVDDEPVVAITLSEILRRHGANVTWFTEPLLALAYVASGPIELLISDINMPLLDGLDLAAQVSLLTPSCRMILLSAVCGQTEITERVSVMNLKVKLLTKPINVPCLLSAISEALPGCDEVAPASRLGDAAQRQD